MSVLTKNETKKIPRQNLLHLPDLNVQPSQILPEQGQGLNYTKNYQKLRFYRPKMYNRPQTQAHEVVELMKFSKVIKIAQDSLCLVIASK